jgi:hypothetical protein
MFFECTATSVPAMGAYVSFLEETYIGVCRSGLALFLFNRSVN